MFYPYFFIEGHICDGSRANYVSHAMLRLCTELIDCSLEGTIPSLTKDIYNDVHVAFASQTAGTNYSRYLFVNAASVRVQLQEIQARTLGTTLPVV